MTKYKCIIVDDEPIAIRIIYVIVHSNGKKLITKESISYFEEKLPSVQFLRVHRGYIENKEYVTVLYGSTLEFGELKIPIGGNYKETVSLFYNK